MTARARRAGSHARTGARVPRSRCSLAAGLLLGLCCSAGRAQPAAGSATAAPAQPGREASPWLERPNPLRAFLPSAEALAADRQARSEALLERRLALLPGVRAAQVRLVLPEAERAPLDRPLPAARAQVLLRSDDPGAPSQAEVARVVREALPELAPLALSLTRTPPARPPAPAPSVRVGPFWVAPGSALPLRIALAACLVSNIVLACLLLLRWRRRAH